MREWTKTGRKGDRRLQFDPATTALLEQHQADQAALAAEHDLPAPVYVFSHDAGVTPWRPGYVGHEYRDFRSAVPGGDRVRFHDFRHYVATTMLADGESLWDTAGQLGHADPRTTARTYAKHLPGRGLDSATRRAGRLLPE